jgi:hypothetical protein
LFDNPDTDDRFDKVDWPLFLSLGFTSKRNDWAGPDHWKYQKVKGKTFVPVHVISSAFCTTSPFHEL